MEVTTAEFAVLEYLWERGQASRREIVDKLYPDRRESDRATVQKLLERLERKGVVRRDASERIHQFSPTVTRAEYVGSHLDSLADSVCGGSFEPLISHLVDAQKLSAGELAELRELIQRAESQQQDAAAVDHPARKRRSK